MVGEPVCHFGISTGYSCGEAETIHYVPPSGYCPGGPCDAAWVKVIDVGATNGVYDIDCAGGDSGGPMFWVTAAWGILSGGSINEATGECAFVIMFSQGGLTWDGVNTRIKIAN
jgi:streptogrisin C